MADDMRGTRDLVLPPSTYAYVLDSTKGKISVFVGPYKSSLSDTDRMVVWNKRTRRFDNAASMDEAVQTFAVAGEGEYIVLENPASDPTPPHVGAPTDAVPLEVGRKVNIPGPANFPLWPGQVATTIAGHHLRHNQYLLVRVYDAALAQENVNAGVVSASPTGDEQAATIAPVGALTLGQLIVIKGTDVSFYMPPTGIEVVPEEGGAFVREAVTLERLEYCILLDESGEKRYVRGPAVVFPEPTETFVTSTSRQSRKFLAIELNAHSGVFVKVIAEYEDETGFHPVGEELFITGNETAIFFPRAEHSIIQYGDQKVHYAIAIPAGEGRYVLDRDTGEVTLVRGPAMFLPDPRTQVVVLRVLDLSLVSLLYPDNVEALEVNRTYMRQNEAAGARHLMAVSNAAVASAATADVSAAAAYATPTRGGASSSYAGDTFARSTEYSRPRSIVLDTKYEGAVAISIWPGYAVLIADKTGNRRVELGPKVVLLEYDETVMPLALSTGKPKNTDNLLRTAYLRVTNNQIGDIITVECRDMVPVTLKVSYRVNFEGDDPLRWFDTENYVKIMTDHARSRLRAAAKRLGVLDFTGNAIDVVRDTILGPSPGNGEQRPGMTFDENGMHIYDVEVLAVNIGDDDVAGLLADAQQEQLRGAVQLSAAEERAGRQARLEGLAQTELAREGVAQANAEQAVAEAVLRTIETELQAGEAKANSALAIRTAADEQELAYVRGQVEAFATRMAAVSPELVVAMQNFGDKEFVDTLLEAVAPAAMAAGVTTADLFRHLFKDTPFEGMMATLAQRPLAPGGANGRREPAPV
jgi:major vault protein